jgi:hypothetical protein
MPACLMTIWRASASNNCVADVNALTQRTETINKNQIDFANQLESIRTDLAKLRGQQEVMSYDLDAAQKRQKDFYIDLDNRAA